MKTFTDESTADAGYRGRPRAASREKAKQVCDRLTGGGHCQLYISPIHHLFPLY